MYLAQSTWASAYDTSSVCKILSSEKIYLQFSLLNDNTKWWKKKLKLLTNVKNVREDGLN